MLIEKQIFGNLAFEEEQFSTFQNAMAFNLLAYSGGRIVGYLMSQKLSDSEAHTGMKGRKRIFYLESVGLLPNYQGKGIGKKLMSAYMDQGLKLKCKEYMLDTKEKSMIVLAEHLGFRKASYNLKHFWNGKKWSGAWIMRKSIGGKK